MACSGVNVKDKLKLFEQKGQTADPRRPGKPKTERPKSRSNVKYSEIFEEPTQLIFTDEKTGKLRCNETALKLLYEINHPLNVVAITGLYRTGKSYLLNRLAGGKTGFNIGNDIHACTKGIWIWCRQHPLDDDQVLVLLDVEGFGDTDKVNRKEDTWLFTLATLLSSSLVYNNRGTLDSSALDRLNFLEEIDSTIEVSEHEEDKKLLDFDFFFPDFVVILRDFDLNMVDKESRRIITPNEYLEGRLMQRRGDGKDIENFNRIRLLIRRYFKKRQCFVFDYPCGSTKSLEKLSDKDIKPAFLKSVDEFSEYIFSREPLKLKSGRNINGRMFSNLVLHYVNEISENKHPSILEATRYMVEVENQTSVTTASELYKKQMQDYIAKLGDINPTDETLVAIHEQCMASALDYFKQAVVFDDQDIFEQNAMSACRSLLSQFKRICDDNSTKSCMDALARLNQKIERKLKNDAYSCDSGYDEYIKDINWIARKYKNLTGLGSKARVVLQTYLDGKEEEETLIHELVLKAQTGEDNTLLKQGAILRQPSQLKSLATSVSRSHSFEIDLKETVAIMEKEMNQDLEKTFKDQKKNIQTSYFNNIETKLEELEKQRSEAQMKGASLSNIEEQIAFFQKVQENPLLKGVGDISDDTNKTEESETVDKTDVIDLGERPPTVGGSQDPVYTEKSRQKRKAGKLWCTIQ